MDSRVRVHLVLPSFAYCTCTSSIRSFAVLTCLGHSRHPRTIGHGHGPGTVTAHLERMLVAPHSDFTYEPTFVPDFPCAVSPTLSTSGACCHHGSSFNDVHNGKSQAQLELGSLTLSGGNTEVSTVFLTVFLQMKMQHWKEDRSIEGVKQLKHTLRQILKRQCLVYLLHEVITQRPCEKWLPFACYREREHIYKRRRTFEKRLPALE